jgi:hypothetical protein
MEFIITDVSRDKVEAYYIFSRVLVSSKDGARELKYRQAAPGYGFTWASMPTGSFVSCW